MTVASPPPWHVTAADRAARVLAAATATADRGAMLRELCRLKGGYLDLAVYGITLSEADIEALPRFGLKRAAVGEAGAVFLNDEDLPPIAGLAEALRLDPAPRQHYPSACADALLLRLSGFDHYRAPTQKAAIRALATMPDGASLLVTLPTGAGKSLLFQMAPRLDAAPGACCVVIVPTVALALAHVETLRVLPGLEGSRCIHSGMDTTERRATYDAFARGETPVLVLSPEVALAAARDLLIEAARDPAKKLPGLTAHLTTFFIDEAHIIESWGRSFRPDFQRLPGLIEALRAANPSLRTILLSATVNNSAREELTRAYGARDFLAIEAKVPRCEFDLVHHRIETAAERDAQLTLLVDRLPRPAIIYTTLVAHAEALHRTITERGYQRLALFTGEVEGNDARLRIVQDWRAGRLDLVIATSAFGMGIDKADVRTVLHACVPESPSRYFQEIGRAARDGNQALALMLWTEDRGGTSPSFAASQDVADATDDDDFHENAHVGLGAASHLGRTIRSKRDRRDDWRLARRLWSRGWLTPPLMRKRWRALVEAADALGLSRVVDGMQRLAIPLDAYHADLDNGDTDYNRAWNRTLLNLLQRAGALAIEATDNQTGAPVWQATLRDPRLLATDAHDTFWDDLANLREVERQLALKDLSAFKHAITRPDTCIAAAIFELVEADAPLVPPCGRCGFCRAAGLAPPRPDQIRFHGSERRWPHAPDKPDARLLRPGITIVQPALDEDSVARELVAGLVGAGIEQFVVPDSHAIALARALVPLPCRFGFVSTHSEALDGWRPAFLPSALFLSPRDPVRALVARLKDWSAADPRQRFVVVAPPETDMDGKPLVNLLSASAPMAEAALRTFVKDVSAL